MIDRGAVSNSHPGGRAIAEKWLQTLPGPLRPSEVGSPWGDLRGSGFFIDAMHPGTCTSGTARSAPTDHGGPRG